MGAAAYLALTVAAGAARLPSAAGYGDGPPIAHTGGFGEPTCQRCHFDHPINDTAGSLRIVGLPADYLPGRRYRLTIVLERPGLRRAGFQAAARFSRGPLSGRQAGRLAGTTDRVEVLSGGDTGIEYARQTEVGSRVDRVGAARWMVEWTAPESPADRVTVHVAGNAANDDASELGDHVYVDSFVLAPTEDGDRRQR